MKKLFVSLGTTGADAFNHGIIQISGIIDIDDTIMEVFNLKCKPYKTDGFSPEILKGYGFVWEELFEDPDRLYPHEAFDKLMGYLNKYVSGTKESIDKFHFIGYNSYGFEAAFLRKFFEKNGHYGFYNYIWQPPIDLMLVASYLLTGYRERFHNIGSYMLGEFFGFDVDIDKLSDSYYKVNLVRSLYYILDKFRSKVVLFKKHTIN
jgi:hypothetical protein